MTLKDVNIIDFRNYEIQSLFFFLLNLEWKESISYKLHQYLSLISVY